MTRPARLQLVLLLLAAAVFHLLFILRTAIPIADAKYFVLFDDAMISMRYGENLANGHGLLWNPGQPPVEGITNLLWTLWMGALHLLPVAKAKTSLLVMLSGSLLLLGNIVIVWGIGRRLSADSALVPIASAMLMAFHYGSIFWTLRGMEVGLLVLLVNLQALLVLGWRERPRPIAMGVLTVLAMATRPDAIVAELVLWFFSCAVAGASRTRTIAAAVLSIAGAFFGLMAFRMGYYGFPFPNTYYLKLGGSTLPERIGRGAPLLLQTFLFHLWPFALPAAAYLFLRRRQWFAEWPLLLLLSLAAAQCAYSVYVGGDAWEPFRFPNRYIELGFPALVLCGVAAGERLVVRALESPLRTMMLLRSALLMIVLLIVVRPVANSLYSSEMETQMAGAHSSQQRYAVLFAIVVVVIAVAAMFAIRSREAEKARLYLQSTLLLKPQAVAALPGAWLAAAILALWVPTESAYFLKWMRENAEQQEEMAQLTRLGVLLNVGTEPDASIAVAWAGVTPYFAGRPAIDVLGKSDAFIAHQPRREEDFRPGHDHYDLRYSIDELRPDLIINLPPLTSEEQEHLKEIGYVYLRSTIHMDSRTTRVNREVMNTLYFIPEAVDATLLGLQSGR